jgi:hypothetical protein
MANTSSTAFSVADRQRYTELLEDASTPLQREMIRRAFTAGHSAAQLHAFADAVRGFSDAEVYARCTFQPNASKPTEMHTLLKAQSDPLTAFRLNGGILTPSSMELPALETKQARPAVHKARTPGFQADSKEATPHTKRTLHPAAPKRVNDHSLFEHALAGVSTALGVSWSELLADSKAARLRALDAAHASLEGGLVVALALRPVKGDGLTFALALQSNVSHSTRAFEILNVANSQSAWVNQGDLVNGNELPFEDKRFRMLCRVGLPRRRQ